MGNFYDDARFGVIKRKWFGLTKKHGGDVADGYTFGTTDATVITQVARWYPRGPIRMLKAGHMVLATLSNASNDLVPARLLTRGGSASSGFSWNVKNTATDIAPFVIGSDITPTVAQVKAGEYITIETATPQTDNGTAANTATTTGTVAFFLDYLPQYDVDGKWDV
jgi:hypothetical protein